MLFMQIVKQEKSWFYLLIFC